MNCPECDHENTEGAWLCINCGAKLPRAEEAEREAAEEIESIEEPSRFEPTISENLRRLRERAGTSSRGPAETGRWRRMRLGLPGLTGVPVATSWAGTA